MTYEIGVVYVWQNQVGVMARLNGVECQVIGRPIRAFCILAGGIVTAQQTDTPCPIAGMLYFAADGDLRRKQPPAGEKSILRMFDLTVPAPREVEAA